MSMLKRLFAPLLSAGPDPREALRPLYAAVVAEAREPAWYAGGGVEDTVTGRFDMVCAVLAAVLARMERNPALTRDSVLLTELFVHDMDGQLRELGIGDIVVGKHIGKLMSTMGGRLGAYRAGLAGDRAALLEAIDRNVTFRAGAARQEVVADRLEQLFARLTATGNADLLAGRIA